MEIRFSVCSTSCIFKSVRRLIGRKHKNPDNMPFNSTLGHTILKQITRKSSIGWSNLCGSRFQISRDLVFTCYWNKFQWSSFVPVVIWARLKLTKLDSSRGLIKQTLFHAWYCKSLTFLELLKICFNMNNTHRFTLMNN